MAYGVIIDIYAPFGFIVFEMRDKFKRPLDPKTPGFILLFNMAKEMIMSQAKGSLKAHKP